MKKILLYNQFGLIIEQFKSRCPKKGIIIFIQLLKKYQIWFLLLIFHHEETQKLDKIQYIKK